jgi:multidrug efflux pump subunit AcrA (membrane-fusion protein)
MNILGTKAGSVNKGRASALALGQATDQILSKSLLLEEAAPAKLVRHIIWLVVVAIFAFIVWAGFAQLDVVSTAKGVVVPVQAVKVIQHFDGGRIASIDVLDGQVVQQGQLLMRLNPTEASAEYKTLEARYWSLWASAQRLRALISDQTPDFTKIPSSYAVLIKEQLLTLTMAREQRDVLEEDIRIYKELRTIRTDLEKEKLVSRVQVLEANKNLNLSESELLRFERKNLDDLNSIASELAQVESQMLKLLDRLERVDIVAPVAGTVQDLKFRTVGGVVPPAAVVMNLVPSDGKVHAEVQIAANDIGFVKIGQMARLKFGAFDFMRYGTVPGQITMISSFSTMDERRAPYFKVLIDISKTQLGQQTGVMTIEPGMTLDADILTDRQSVLRYLMRPIYYALTQGMRER